MKRSPMADIVSQRLKGAFGSTYLTLMSIIQGVAMAALAARVGDTADHLTLADWILIGDTFLVFVVIWNAYLVTALSVAWVPTFLDSLLPFTLLAMELFLARFAVHNMRGWLLAMAGVSLASMVGLLHTLLRMRAADRSYREMYSALAGNHYLTIASTAAGTILFFAAGLLYDVAGLSTAPLVVVAAATAAVGVYVSRAVAVWGQIHSFIHQGREPAHIARTRRAHAGLRPMEQLRRMLAPPALRRRSPPPAES